MARRRFFVEQIRDGGAVIEGDEAAHLTRVLRVEEGQRFEISDNHQVWLAEVKRARKSLVEFTLLEPLDPGPELPSIDLYAALFKFDRFEWMIEKVTELGVRRIIPVETARSERGLFAAAAKRVERWRKIVREASQQARRRRLPEVEDAIRLNRLPTGGWRIVLDEEPGAPRLQAAIQPLALLIGPEGGWTSEERDGLRASGWVAASLGRTVLRAETAGIAAVAIAMHEIEVLTDTLNC